MKKSKIILVSVVTLALMIAGGFWILQKNSRYEQSMHEQKNKNEKERVWAHDFEQFIKENGTKIELEDVDTTNWQMYTDKKRGFSFKYPSDWTLEEKTYEKSRQYKDCYDALGDSGGCDDYDVKALIQNNTFICLVPQNYVGKCYIKFEELTPRVKHVSSVWEMFMRNVDINKYEYEYFLLDKDHILSSMRFRVQDNKAVRVQAYVQNGSQYKRVPVNKNDIKNLDNYDLQYVDVLNGILQSLIFQE